MAQIKDDCFAFGDNLMQLEDALAILIERVKPIMETEMVRTSSAISRILAENILAPRDVPPCDNSAVDGYAVFFDDLNLKAKTRLPVKARVAAGHPLEGAANHGEAIRIFTGAPMPVGMDTVYMEEDCEVVGPEVILPPGLKKGANRRLKGEDVKKNDLVIAAGKRLRPQELGLAATIGRAELRVFKPLKTAIFSTGDEVYDPIQEAPKGCIYDANRYTIMGLLHDLGCSVTDLGIISDNEDAIAKTLAKATTGHDLILTSGGVSAGEEDHVKAAVTRDGTIHFWRLSIKPGRPIALGQVARTPFIGLPGNPVAAMVTFMIIARPLILMLAGASDISATRFPVKAGFPYKKKLGRREWVRAKLRQCGDSLVAEKYSAGGSGILRSMVFADGLIELSEEQIDVNVGDVVNYLPFNEVSR
ncbi:MAG: molybdopterin molybdenumtransferase MoeA [Magnetovibrio sp.]|nr:molybdopterin molybdenumtransferase MoeA [Magnetovibrio sp.]